MLSFTHLLNLRTTKIVFEDVYDCQDFSTLEQLKALTSKRNHVQSINSLIPLTQPNAREMSWGSVSHYQQDIQKLEQYLPLLHNLVDHIDSIGDESLNQKLGISWTSPLTLSPPSPYFLDDLRVPESFLINNLHFELRIILFFYGAMLREWATKVLSTDLLQSATLFRRAAGVYRYLACEFIPSIKDAQSSKWPPEATKHVCYVMLHICLAESQIVAMMKAKEQKPDDVYFFRAHWGIVQQFDTAMSHYSKNTKELKNLSPILMEYMSCYKILYELKTYKYMAEAAKAKRNHTDAIALLFKAFYNVQISVGGTESWRKVIKQEVETLEDMLYDYGFFLDEHLQPVRGKLIIRHLHDLKSYQDMVNAAKDKGDHEAMIALIFKALYNVQISVSGTESQQKDIKQMVNPALEDILNEYGFPRDHHLVSEYTFPLDHKNTDLRRRVITSSLKYVPQRLKQTLGLLL